jgi:hypothetical protein
VLQGWQHERVAIKLSSKGDRIIYVIPGDPTFHLYKVWSQTSHLSQPLFFGSVAKPACAKDFSPVIDCCSMKSFNCGFNPSERSV